MAFASSSGLHRSSPATYLKAHESTITSRSPRTSVTDPPQLDGNRSINASLAQSGSALKSRSVNSNSARKSRGQAQAVEEEEPRLFEALSPVIQRSSRRRPSRKPGLHLSDLEQSRRREEINNHNHSLSSAAYSQFSMLQRRDDHDHPRGAESYRSQESGSVDSFSSAESLSQSDAQSVGTSIIAHVSASICILCIRPLPRQDAAVWPCGHCTCWECCQELPATTCPLCFAAAPPGSVRTNSNYQALSKKEKERGKERGKEKERALRCVEHGLQAASVWCETEQEALCHVCTRSAHHFGHTHITLAAADESLHESLLQMAQECEAIHEQCAALVHRHARLAKHWQECMEEEERNLQEEFAAIAEALHLTWFLGLHHLRRSFRARVGCPPLPSSDPSTQCPPSLGNPLTAMHPSATLQREAEQQALQQLGMLAASLKTSAGIARGLIHLSSPQRLDIPLGGVCMAGRVLLPASQAAMAEGWKGVAYWEGCCQQLEGLEPPESTLMTGSLAQHVVGQLQAFATQAATSAQQTVDETAASVAPHPTSSHQKAAPQLRGGSSHAGGEQHPHRWKGRQAAVTGPGPYACSKCQNKLGGRQLDLRQCERVPIPAEELEPSLLHPSNFYVDGPPPGWIIVAAKYLEKCKILPQGQIVACPGGHHLGICSPTPEQSVAGGAAHNWQPYAFYLCPSRLRATWQ